MEIKILGGGCAKCKKLYQNTENAVQELGVDATIVKVTDMKTIAEYGVMRTPAVVIDEEVKAFGKVLSSEDIKKLISN